MLHLITCHGRIMPRLAELLFSVVFFTKNPCLPGRLVELTQSASHLTCDYREVCSLLRILHWEPSTPYCTCPIMLLKTPFYQKVTCLIECWVGWLETV